MSARSRVWFTLTNGVVSEVFYPSIDRPNTRRIYVVVATRGHVFVESDASEPRVRTITPWAPAYEVRTPVPDTGLELCKTVITDSTRSVLLQRARLEGNDADLRDARVFIIAEPHVDGGGASNDGWLGEYKGVPAVFARHHGFALALLCSRPFLSGACTYLGTADAVADLRANGQLTRTPPSALDGNLQIAAEIALDESREWVIALGFGGSADHAAQQARASLAGDFDRAVRRYVGGWRRYHRNYPARLDDDDPVTTALHDSSLTVLRVHQDKERTGAIIASVAIPWGDAHGDQQAGGYHLVWPRDLVEAAEALVAAGVATSARRTLAYLMSTQETAGLWPQNMWLDGTPLFHGIQLDEIALPILLAGKLARDGALGDLDPWPMVRAAAGYIARTGPCTRQDRWEEEGGYSPYTIAAAIAALIVAAGFAERAREPALAQYLCDTADQWNASLEQWTYVAGTALAQRYGVHGYYVRLTPPAAIVDNAPPIRGTPLPIENQRCMGTTRPYEEIVSPDALALVRFGLRRADDPRILDTVAIIDGELRTVTRRGPVWHRYTMDGYGETPDGSPHLVWGVGRGWPLLTGERAHYEIARGCLDRARALRRAMATQANETGLLPEQIWDADDVPSHRLYNGRPTGSAMPLVWAHAEFIKLCRSIQDGRVWDTPAEVADRYRNGGPAPRVATWRPDRAITRAIRGRIVRVEAAGARTVDWCIASSEVAGCVEARDSGVGIAHADLPTAELPAGAEVRFRIRGGAEDGAREYRVRIDDR